MARLKTSMNPIARALLLSVAAITLAACAGTGGVEEGGGAGAGAAGDQGGTAGDKDGKSFTAEQLNQRGLLGIEEDERRQFLDPDNPLSTRTIYFEFDSSRIQSRFNEAIKAHAQYLADHPKTKLRLEGHTDERGTREYNVALGERRAESGEKALTLAGAPGDRITTLSFGEERPAVLGSTEEAYAKNRRVELIYVK